MLTATQQQAAISSEPFYDHSNRSALLSPRTVGGELPEVQTLASVDAGRVANLLLSFHELWSLPLQILGALYLLYTQASGCGSSSRCTRNHMALVAPR